MNYDSENRSIANSAVSSTICGTAGGRCGGLEAAKKWASFLPSKLMSPHRKANKVFLKMKSLSMMSALLVKFKYVLGRGKKRASKGKYSEEALPVNV